MPTKKVLVCGGGGFIGSHLVSSLKADNYVVHAVDLKDVEYGFGEADVFHQLDLRDPIGVRQLIASNDFDEIYQLAADMGGAEFVFTGEHDADIMHNSATINLNLLHALVQCNKRPRVFYSSSACIYPEHNQMDPANPICLESSAYPANPDSDYGWEKLFSERLYDAFSRNYQLETRIARYHNIFGPYGTYAGGREKAPAALCRKVASLNQGEKVEIFGDGNQTRSFLYVDDCVEATRKLMESDFPGPVNIGSTDMISIRDLALLVGRIAGKSVSIKSVPGPTGVNGRNSDNRLIEKELKWKPSITLEQGLRKTYEWIQCQIR